MTMFSYGFLSCLFIASIEALHPSCSSLQNKLNHYSSRQDHRSSSWIDRPVCQGLNNRTLCCSSKDEDRIHRITAIELTELFQTHFMPIEQALVYWSDQWNDTCAQLIESMRNETLLLFQRDYPKSFRSFRRPLETFFDHLRQLSGKTSREQIKVAVEDLFRQLLQHSLMSNTNLRFAQCLWQYQPFGQTPNLLIEQLDTTLTKLVHLNDLFKLSLELVRTISRTVDQDDSCFDAYQQLFICNLCTNQNVLPCWSTCLEIMDNCLVNRTLLHDLWKDLLEIIERMRRNSHGERDLLSFGRSLSDSLFTFLKSDAFESTQIINHCGSVHRRRDIIANVRTVSIPSKHSLSFVNRSLEAIKDALEIYQSFWLILPKQICQSNGIKALNGSACWTGTSISIDGRTSMRFNYEKPLSLRLQRILKEIREKSQNFLSNNDQRNGSVKKNSSAAQDDDAFDPDLEYSDYAYEDTADEFSSSTMSTSTSTEILSSSLTFDDDLSSNDDANTVSYYDYEEDDDDVESNGQTSITQPSSTTRSTTSTTISTTTTTTIASRVPMYHRRRPIIWNITIEKERSSTGSSLISSSSSFFIIFFTLNLIKT